MSAVLSPRAIVLVTGGRDYGDAGAVDRALREAAPGLIVEGGHRVYDAYTGKPRRDISADALADAWGKDNGVHVLRIDALWAAHHFGAGPKRNAVMVELVRRLAASGAGPEALVLAFPGGTGTADCVKRARAAGLNVREVA